MKKNSDYRSYGSYVCECTPNYVSKPPPIVRNILENEKGKDI
jgi:hypothetical protein